MLKTFVRHLLIIFTAGAVNIAAAEILRIGNAANGAHFPVLQQVAMEMAFSGKVQVSQQRIKPSAAMEALRKNEFDLLILDSRFLPEKHSGLRCYPYAAEALCIYIHPGNPLGSLTKAEVLEIITADAPVWRNYNGQGEKIQRIMLKANHPGSRLFQRLFGNRLPAADIFRVSSFAQLTNFLNPAAAGIAPFTAERNAETIAVPVNDVVPDSVSVRNGRYPLTLHYILVTPEKTPESVNRFLEEVFSPANRRKLSGTGMIPLGK